MIDPGGGRAFYDAGSRWGSVQAELSFFTRGCERRVVFHLRYKKVELKTGFKIF